MALYGHEDWGSNNMDMRVHFDPALDEEVKGSCCVEFRLLLEDSILSEIAEVEGGELVFHKVTTVQDLLSPRQGICRYVPTGLIHIIWHHLQVDGVGCERAAGSVRWKPTPDSSSVSAPPPIVPELMGIPQMVKSATSAAIAQGIDIEMVEQHFTMWMEQKSAH